MKKKILFYIKYILCLIIFVSCSEKKEITATITEQEFYTVMPKQDYELNPHIYKDTYSRALIIQLWEGITELKNNGVRLVSANKIDHSENFKKWSIELREDLKWSDGKKIDAKTYLDSWLSALTDENISEEIYRMFVIEGAEEIFKNKNQRGKLGVSAQGNKLLISLNTPVENFDEWLANPIFYPIREENKNLSENDLLVNGAFKILTMTENDIVLEKNKEYWDSANTRLKKVNIKLVENEIMAYEMFPRVEIDFFGLPFYDIPFERRKQISSLPEKIEFPISKYSYISFLSNDKFINQEEVKKVLYSVTDPEFMGKVIIQNSSPSIFEHPHPSSDTLEEAKEKFNKLKEENNIVDFPEGGYIAYSPAGKILEKRLLLSTLKEWISQFKMPIRVKSTDEIKPTFSFETHLLGTNRFEDFYYYINYKYQNQDKKLLIKNNEEFLEKLPVLPLNKINTSVLVHSTVQGLYISPNGDLHLKYIYMK